MAGYKAKPYIPNCDVFGVGSYPFKDAATACRRILKQPNLLLHWPQLPRRSSKEKLIDQTYAALRTPGDAFSKGSAPGINTMWKLLSSPRLKKSRQGDRFFKTQLAGPITLFGKLQARGKAKRMSQAKLLRYVTLWLEHAFWQIEQIQNHDFEPIVVLDEPLLPNFMGQSGSAQSRRTLKLLRSMITRLRKRGAIVGIHCCNRVSPATLIDLGVDLLHFDAYHFPTQLLAAREKLQRFMMDDGIVAWGIIPTTEPLSMTVQSKLEKTLTDLFLVMETRGLSLKRVMAQSMISSTCGTGLLGIDESDRIMDFASKLSKQFKNRYGL